MRRPLLWIPSRGVRPGRSLSQTVHFSEANENVSATVCLGPADLPEITQGIA